MPRFHRLKVAEVRPETAAAVSIRFALPSELANAFRFVPGQHLTIRTTIGGAKILRTYSICSGIDDGGPRIGVKHAPGGCFSSFANRELRPGMELEVMTPTGRFNPLPLDPSASHRYAAFAAGSGITPILSIVTSVLTREPNSEVILCYGNRSSASIMFRERLDDLKDRHLARFSLVHLLSREAQDLTLLHGRLDGTKIRQLASTLFDARAQDRIFLCGPGTMIAEARAALADLGVARERILSEHFAPGVGRPTVVAPAAPAESPAASTGTVVEVVLDGAHHRFVMDRPGERVVDAALRQGLTLPFSCKGGMCCTCRARLLAGRVEMAANYSLQPWELERGFILCCQSEPRSDHLLIDFDQI